jgi:hypothetical protein
MLLSCWRGKLRIPLMASEHPKGFETTSVLLRE